VAVTGWFFRPGEGSTDLAVTVRGPGFEQTWTNQAVDPWSGQASFVESGSIELQPGDQIRFEVHNLGQGHPGSLSWAPGVAVLDRSTD